MTTGHERRRGSGEIASEQRRTCRCELVSNADLIMWQGVRVCVQFRSGRRREVVTVRAASNVRRHGDKAIMLLQAYGRNAAGAEGVKQAMSSTCPQLEGRTSG